MKRKKSLVINLVLSVCLALYACNDQSYRRRYYRNGKPVDTAYYNARHRPMHFVMRSGSLITGDYITSYNAGGYLFFGNTRQGYQDASRYRPSSNYRSYYRSTRSSSSYSRSYSGGSSRSVTRGGFGSTGRSFSSGGRS
jgi:uncharacterized membrane protein YgcG